VTGLGALIASGVGAQQRVTRADAIDAALTRSAPAALARADSAAGAAGFDVARTYPNPSVAWSYSKDTPHYHVLASVPLDLPWVRAARVDAARATRDAARFGFAYEEAQLRYDADTTYTRALAARGRARLSRRDASDADSLLRMAEVRRDAGDASELDVELARVNAGGVETEAADDSLTALDAVLAVQLVMGLPGDSVQIALGDTLAPPHDITGPPLAYAVAAAAARFDATTAGLALARRSAFAGPSFQVGFDTDDPGPTGQQGLLPTFGVTLPLPLFNRNGAAVTQAVAARDWAAADLERVRQAATAEVAAARRRFDETSSRLDRSRALVASAERVAGMSLQAYREGAVPLANVLDAELRARDALGRYIDDLAATNNSAALLRLLAGPP
jgi:cobalt-zinc-cadmium efflux system outer membrane protein